MSGFVKRSGALLATLLLAGGLEYALRIEKHSNVDSYYRELGESDQPMGRFERAVFSVLLAASDKLHKHKS